MIVKKIVRLVLGVTVIAGAMGGCKCGRDTTVDEAQIDELPISNVQPDADRPRVEFPRSAQTDDIALNGFIDTVLKACERGDYDKFRQSFGAAYKPISKNDFEQYWHNVQTITVAEVRANPQKKDSPEYYLHTTVRLREPDRKSRQTRDAVVVLFQELGEWRMVPASKEVIQRVLAGRSTPDSMPADTEE